MPLLSGCQADLRLWTQPVPATAPAAPAPRALSLIPEPQQLTRRSGTFMLSSGTPLVCPSPDDSACAWTAGYLAGLLQRTRGLTLSQARQADGPAVVFHRVPDMAAEAYRLNVTPAGVEISAGSDAGLLYGAITFWQLATQETTAATQIGIPAVEISDAPRFAWRGLLLDSARHFQPPQFIKSFGDAMALHKLNVLQWHLTDDQGWRIQIKRYPRLTSVGAWRTNAREGRYGGFYTQDQIRDIVAYAKRRNVTIVPEIEMPGHALAAIVSYPRLGSTRHVPKGVSGDWGVFPYLFNVDNRTFTFLENVLGEVMDLFHSPFIHVGGDEAPKDQWKASRRIRKQMRRLHVKDADALQGYFTARIGRFLEAHGRRLIGWDEILQAHPAPSAVVMSWRTVESAGQAADEGHDVVLSPAPALYFDYCQAVREGEPTCRGMQVPLKDVYTFDPQPTGALKQHLIGIQANIWTEHLPAGDAVDYAAFPRAAALAELAWSPHLLRDWPDFLARLPAQFDRYRALGIVYSDAAFAVDVDAKPAAAGADVSLGNQAGFGEIRYTLDGSAPTPASSVYTAPFETALPVTVTAAPFYDGQAIAKPTTAHLDARSLLRRNSYTMDQCSNDLPLAEAGGVDDARAVMMVNVMNPCWIYRGLDASNIDGMDIAVAHLPFNFQIGADIRKIPLYPQAAPSGQLELHLDSCSGALLAVLPLAEAAKNAGFTTLHAAFAPRAGVHDVCLLFARRSVDPVWSIDWVQPSKE